MRVNRAGEGDGSGSGGNCSWGAQPPLSAQHLQEVLQLPEVEGQGSPEVTLTELGPDGSKEGGHVEVEDGAQGREEKAAPMQPAMTTVPPQPEEEDGLSYICEYDPDPQILTC